ncbi:MAG: DUF4416 family protein, partial [Fibrobacter sp.]|nr:DUF4416 family protein [Fibrobacter sp.]
MADTKTALPVKYFIAVLFSDSKLLCDARQRICSLWGEIDIEGEDHLFDVTDYYKEEMGEPIYRRIVSLNTLYDPMLIVQMKLICNNLEKELSVNGKRSINLDAGYLDHNKILLASAKEAGQKIYLGDGIYADLAGRYKAGKYQPFEWSFPDFKDGRYDTELLKLRA